MLIPLTFNELLLYHNKKELFLSKYKTAQSITINYNKRDMNLSYLIIKAWTAINPKHRPLLLQIKKLPQMDTISSKKALQDFLVHYIVEKTQCRNDKEAVRIVDDYVSMCRTVHKKISINFTSVKKVQEEHDQISQKYYQRSTPKVTIKKDTKFTELRKILPNTFEWIKTRKRLIQETTMQNHCVWSYASFINKDKCQIYSYVDERGERYTLEFRTKRNKYFLQQACGKHNTINTQINQYIEDILANYYAEVNK